MTSPARRAFGFAAALGLAIGALALDHALRDRRLSRVPSVSEARARVRADAGELSLVVHVDTARCGVPLNRGFTVYVRPFQGDRAPSPEELLRYGVAAHDARGPGFDARISARRGRYLIGAGLAGFAQVQATAVVDVGARERCELELPPFDPDILATVAGIPEGLALRTLTLDFRSSDPMRQVRIYDGGLIEALAQPGARYAVVLRPVDRQRWAETAAGGETLVLTASTSEKRALAVPVPYAKGAQASFSFAARRARLEAAVEGYEGSGLEGALDLKLVPRGVSINESAWYLHEGPFLVDGRGRCVFDPIEPGEYDLLLCTGLIPARGGGGIGGPDWASRMDILTAIARIPIELRSGKNQASVAVPKLELLSVVVEGSGQVFIQLDGAPEGNGWPLTAAVQTGPSSFRLPPGKYRIEFLPSAGSKAAASVTLDGPREVRLGAK